MGLQLAVSTRKARLDALETEIGASAVMKLFGGTIPGNCAAADAGSPLVTMTLGGGSGGDWMAAAASGSKAKNGTWQGTASAGGTATHFRIYDSGGTVCRIQGSCGIGTGDLQLDNTSITSSQVVTITGFTLNENANA